MDSHRRASMQLILVWVATALMMTSGMPDFGGPAAAQDEQARDKGSVTFTELNDSGLSGTAELTARGERTAVSLWINGAVGDHPTHIHTGRCGDLDPNPKYPLNNVELNTTELVGISDSVIDVPLAELLASDHLILVHKSMAELDTYYACGDIVAGTTAAAVPDAVDTPADPALGGMGSGPMSDPDGGLGMAGSLGLAAIALGLVAWRLRRRELHS